MKIVVCVKHVPDASGERGFASDLTLDREAVDGLLSDEDRAIRDTVRAFADKELAPHVADWYEQGTLPEDLGPKLGELGLLGMHLEGYGCAGTTATVTSVSVGDSTTMTTRETRNSSPFADSNGMNASSPCTRPMSVMARLTT